MWKEHPETRRQAAAAAVPQGKEEKSTGHKDPWYGTRRDGKDVKEQAEGSYPEMPGLGPSLCLGLPYGHTCWLTASTSKSNLFPMVPRLHLALSILTRPSFSLVPRLLTTAPKTTAFQPLLAFLNLTHVPVPETFLHTRFS